MDCTLAGALQSALAHPVSAAVAYGASTPFDLIRCNAQTFPLIFGAHGQQAFGLISSRGVVALACGNCPLNALSECA
jgi:hypothetical protein